MTLVPYLGDDLGKIHAELMGDFLRPTTKGYNTMVKTLVPTPDEILEVRDS